MLDKIQQKITAFLQKYSKYTHFVIIAWNLLIVGWATGIPVNLSEIGIPYSVNVRSIVSYVQAHTHIPTWVLAVLGFLVNATIAYSSWKKSHLQTVDVKPGDVLVASPSVNQGTDEKLKVAIVPEVKKDDTNS